MVPKTSLKIRIPILVITLVAVFTIACTAQPPIAGAGTSTPTAAASQTPNATQLYQRTLQANQTQNALRVPTQAAFLTQVAETASARALTPAATSTPTVSPTLMTTSRMPIADAADYELAEPDAKALVDIIRSALQQYHENEYCEDLPADSTCRYKAALKNESLSIMRFADETVDRSAPMDLGEAFMSQADRFKDYTLFNFVLNETTRIGLTSFMVDYLNENKTILDGGQKITNPFFSASVQMAELDGDANPEWLLKTYFESFNFLFLTLLDESPTGIFQSIPTPFGSNPTYFLDQEEFFFKDVTGDGNDEVIIITEDYFGGGWNALLFTVFTFEDSSFRLLSTIDASYSGFSQYQNSYEWIQNPSTGLNGLKIRWDTNWKWGCLTSEFTETFWTGGEEHRTDTSTGEPETVDCAIGRSVDPYYSPGSDTAIRWLEKALTLNQGSPELTSEELTLVYYHLAVLYLKQGDAPNSHRYLGLIEDLAGADIEIAANLWAEIQPLLLVGELKYYSLCEAAHRLALPLSDVSPHGDVYVYEYKGTDAGYKVPLCDPFGVQLETLNGLIFEQDEDSLRSAILDAGLPLVEIIQVSLPGNQIGWTVVLDEFAFVSPFGFSDGTGKSLYGFFGGRGWAWINTFGGPIDFQSISQDWNNDGLPEIGFAAGKFGWEYGCEDQNTGYEVVWIADVKQSITVTSHGIYCFPDNLPFDWDFIALDKDGDGFSDWALDQLYWTSGSIDTIQSEFQVVAWKVTISESREIIEVGSVSTRLSDLDRRFFDSTNRAVFRSELLDLINQWSVEISPLGDHVNAHLRYLLALTYEAEGDEIHAVETFYALWADHPDTLWGQLAAARLELKP